MFFEKSLSCILAFLYLCAFSNSAFSDTDVARNKTQTCPTKPLSLEVGGHILHVDNRTSLLIEGDDAHQEIGGSYERCDVDFIPNVKSVGWRDLQISKTSFPNNTAASLYKYYLDPTNLHNATEILGNGTAKFQRKINQIFVLPIDGNATDDGTPVVITCDVPAFKPEITKFTKCMAIYKHASGLQMKYRFPRKDVEENQFISIDQKFQKRLQKLLGSPVSPANKP